MLFGEFLVCVESCEDGDGFCACGFSCFYVVDGVADDDAVAHLDVECFYGFFGLRVRALVCVCLVL